jgi:hypothetical protein
MCLLTSLIEKDFEFMNFVKKRKREKWFFLTLTKIFNKDYYSNWVNLSYVLDIKLLWMNKCNYLRVKMKKHNHFMTFVILNDKYVLLSLDCKEYL